MSVDPPSDTAPHADAPPEPPVDAPSPQLQASPSLADAPTPPAEAPLSAADRVQFRPPRSASPRRTSLRKLLALGVLGAAVATAAVLWMGRAGEDADLLGRLVDASESFRPELVTATPDVASGFVYDTFGWPVGVPELPELQLVGVGEALILSTPELEVSMPAFRYEGADEDAAVVFVYDYVLLDGAGDALVLPDPMYARLAEDPPVDVRRQAGHYVVTWRDRSVIYAAVTENEATSERISQAIP